METQNSDSGLSLLADPFSLNDDEPEETSAPFVLPVAPSPPTADKQQSRFNHTFGAPSTPGNLQPNFIALSPSPSPLAQNSFNPDVFFASPVQPQTSSVIPASERFTPELKRRLFGPTDPLSSAPTTFRKSPTKPPSSLGLNTPIPQPSFATASSNPTDDPANSLQISPSFSSSSKLFPEVTQSSQPLNHIASASTAPDYPLNKLTIISQTLRPQPGTPFTPAPHKAKCSCKASKCLKLYCPCFAHSSFCGPDCTCKNCQNTINTSRAVRDARETVLARDPRAFDPKIRNAASAANGVDIHSKGCNCRKGCSKNYCVCRELRVDCGPRCTCSGPNGCQNGKSDSLEDHQFKASADYILDGSRPRSPGRPQSRFMSKAARAKSNNQGTKRQRKRQKKESPEKVVVSPTLQGMDDILSPSFPLFNFSPQGSLANEIENFRNVINSGTDGIPPLPLRKEHESIGEESLGKDLVVPMVTPTGERLPDDRIIFTNLTMDGAPSQSNETPDHEPMPSLSAGENITTKKLDFSGTKVESQIASTESPARKEADAVEEDGAAKLEGSGLCTPKRKLITDLESASSPTTDGKDTVPRSWSRLRGALLGKEEQSEVCRLPRILRVKVGSGRSLRKFEM